jgi:hypothetical protein
MRATLLEVAVLGLTLLACVVVATGCQDDPTRSVATPPTAAASTTSSAAPSATATPVAKLTQARVDATVEAQLPALRERCYQPVRDKLGDSVELSLIAELATDGSVTDVTVAGGGATWRPLRNCVEDAARAWSFGPGAGGTVTATVTLAPAADAGAPD